MIINKHHIKSPTEIVTTTLGIPEAYKQQCIQEAYKIGDSIDREKSVTNVKAFRSGYKIWEETNVYNLLFDRITYALNRVAVVKWEFWDAWTAIYQEGHYTIPHAHDPSYLSFVYYLKANNTSSPLVFDGCDFNLSPYDDLLVIFPSYLTHSVPKHTGEDRICVAGNINRVLG